MGTWQGAFQMPAALLPQQKHCHRGEDPTRTGVHTASRLCRQLPLLHVQGEQQRLWVLVEAAVLVRCPSSAVLGHIRVVLSPRDAWRAFSVWVGMLS